MMFDQMFTADNFRRVFDSENRKGIDVATRFFPELEPATNNVREKVKEIRELRKSKNSMEPSVFEEKLTELRKSLAQLKEIKSQSVSLIMENLSKKVGASDFKIAISQKIGPKGKPVFCIDSNPETFFAMKQLQRNISNIYDVKQANRHDLACQVRDIIGSKFPFEMVRTDISSFYENIDRKVLIEKLDHDQLLSASSKKYIKQILDAYGLLSGSAKGIPRGIGISAYLAELYLKPVDNLIREIPGIVVYCRFVDDIVAAFARPSTGSILGSFKAKIIEILGQFGLTHNPHKTIELFSGRPSSTKVEYLGYRYRVNSDGKLQISPGAAKISKYKQRIRASFREYWKTKPINPRLAFRQLSGRIRFLTGNTRLSNNKSCAVTGIYFNNSLATDMSGLALLDKQLSRQIKKLNSTRLQNKLKKMKFLSGFEQKRYNPFSTKQLQMIVGAWKHG